MGQPSRKALPRLTIADQQRIKAMQDARILMFREWIAEAKDG